MRIRTKVLLSQLILVGAILLVTGAVFVAMQRLAYHGQREEWADRQLEAIMSLALHASRHRAEVGAALLLDEAHATAPASLRERIARDLEALDHLITEEVRFVDRPEEKESELRERETLLRMRDYAAAIDRAAARALQWRSEGRVGEAVATFRGEIEAGPYAALERLLRAAMEDEREEARRTDADAAAVASKLAIGVVAAAALAAALGLCGALLLHRAIAGPVRLLAEGANALGRGDLDHRIAHQGADELGQLSRRFNEMAAQLAEQKRSLLAAQQDLERQVRQRTQALQDANRRLTELDRQRARFLADISHELRTPLTVLRGEAEVTLRQPGLLDAGCRETLARIVDKANQMGRLIDELLFLARAEADTAPLALERVCLQRVVAEALEDGRILAGRRCITLQTDMPDEPIHALVDPRRFKQAILVAVDNAVKYSDDGASVRVLLRAGDADAEIAILDDGMGIPAGDLPHVFDRFYRGVEARSGPRSGNGVGLSIAKWIAERHGGEVSIASAPGQGTALRFRLPLSAAGQA